MAADESLPNHITHNLKTNKKFWRWKKYPRKSRRSQLHFDAHGLYHFVFVILSDRLCSWRLRLHEYSSRFILACWAQESKDYGDGEHSLRRNCFFKFLYRIIHHSAYFSVCTNGIMLSLMRSRLRSTCLQFVCRVIVSVCCCLVLVQCSFFSRENKQMNKIWFRFAIAQCDDDFECNKYSNNSCSNRRVK